MAADGGSVMTLKLGEIEGRFSNLAYLSKIRVQRIEGVNYLSLV